MAKPFAFSTPEVRLGALCAPFFFLTLFKGGELEAGEVAPELGVAGCLLELPVRLGGVKLGGVKGEKK